MHTSKTPSALPFFIFFSIILTATRGFYAQWAIVGIMFIYCFFLMWYAVGNRMKLDIRDIQILTITNLILMASTPQLFYPIATSWNIRISLVAASASVISAVLMHVRNQKIQLLGFGSVIFLLLIIRILPIFGDPVPKIDVFFVYRDAARALLHGQNPYSILINSPMDMLYTTPWFPYPPGILYLLAPVVGLLHDPRYAAVLIDCCIGYFISKGVKSPLRQWIWILLLSFPLTPFIIEQSYMDTLSILMVYTVWSAMRHGRWLVSGIATAFIISTKQYLVLILLPYIQMVSINRKIYPALLGFMMYCIYAIFPFFFIDPNAFITHTVFSAFTKEMPRLDGLSMYPLLTHIHIPYSFFLPLGAIMCTAIICGIALKRGLISIIGATGMIFFSLFLWGPRSFINYYFPVYMMLLIEFLLPHLVQTKKI